MEFVRSGAKTYSYLIDDVIEDRKTKSQNNAINWFDRNMHMERAKM